MFESLSGKFAGALGALRSRGKISEKDINAAVIDIRSALLEADVALEVVEDFTQKVEGKSLALLETLQAGSNQAQAIFDVVNQELTEILGGGALPASRKRRIIGLARTIVVRLTAST